MAELLGKWDDRRIETILSNLLRAGVIASAAVVAIGGAIYLIRHGGEAPAYHVFQGAPPDLRSVPGVFRRAFALSGRGLIQSGLLMLILTPVARVLFSVVGFALERDWIYVTITLIVLGLLCYSLAGT